MHEKESHDNKKTIGHTAGMVHKANSNMVKVTVNIDPMPASHVQNQSWIIFWRRLLAAAKNEASK